MIVAACTETDRISMSTIVQSPVALLTVTLLGFISMIFDVNAIKD